jgi:hypothetical protein
MSELKTYRPLMVDDHRHGSENAYKNYGCRCAPCRDAHIIHRRVQRTLKKTSVWEKSVVINAHRVLANFSDETTCWVFSESEDEATSALRLVLWEMQNGLLSSSMNIIVPITTCSINGCVNPCHLDFIDTTKNFSPAPRPRVVFGVEVKSKVDSTCSSGKVAYASESDARQAVSRSKKSYGFSRFYECDRCPDYHLSTRPLRATRHR